MPVTGQYWPEWKKIAFRFIAIFFFLQIFPWPINAIPLLNIAADYYYDMLDWLVTLSNSRFFHISKELVPVNGSGDTSFAWAQLLLSGIIAFIVTVVWTLIDRRRCNYASISYYLHTYVRFYIIYISINYGVSKLFLQQMPYPSISQLATPLGDFLPMRLSWMLFGYARTYQVFGGIMEIVVGLLLIPRRTIALGAFLGTCVYFNVMMLNLSFDIPVKIASATYTIFCLYLLSPYYWRLWAFFIQNRSIPAPEYYTPHFSRQWMSVATTVSKWTFVLLFVLLPFFTTYNYTSQETPNPVPSILGIYNVTAFAINRDTIPYNDARNWKDIVFDRNNMGSINTTDARLATRYGRAYFKYEADTVHHTIVILTNQDTEDWDTVYNMHYQLTPDKHLRLWAHTPADTLYMDVVPGKKHFQLTENQFHWLTETVR